MRIYMAELVELVKQEEHRQLLKELPIGLIEVPNLLERSFRRLVEGDYTMEEARKALPPYFHDFLKINLRTKSESLRRKIVDTNVEKFLKGKLGLTRKDILRRLLKEFREYTKYFLPKNADKLPPYRLWDHKIEIIPGN